MWHYFIPKQTPVLSSKIGTLQFFSSNIDWKRQKFIKLMFGDKNDRKINHKATAFWKVTKIGCIEYARYSNNLIFTQYEAIVEFGAPEHLTAFGARTFLVFSHQKWTSILKYLCSKFCNELYVPQPQPFGILRRPQKNYSEDLFLCKTDIMNKKKS
jgi:hypothetical protein